MRPWRPRQGITFWSPTLGFSRQMMVSQQRVFLYIYMYYYYDYYIYIYTAKYANPLRNAATNITLVFHSSLCDKDDIRLDPLGSPGGLHLDNHNV